MLFTTTVEIMTHTQWCQSRDYHRGQASVSQTVSNLDSTHLLLPRRLAGAEHEEAVDDAERLRPLRRFELRQVNTSFHAHNFTGEGLPFGVVGLRRRGVRPASPCCSLLAHAAAARLLPHPTWRLTRPTKTHPPATFEYFTSIPFTPASFYLPQCSYYQPRVHSKNYNNIRSVQHQNDSLIPPPASFKYSPSIPSPMPHFACPTACFTARTTIHRLPY